MARALLPLGRTARWQGILIAAGLFAAALTSAATVRLSFENVQTDDGEILVLVAEDEAGFGNWKKAVERRILPAGDAAEAVLTFNLEPGTYAISVLHDLNGNQKLDKKWFGMPKEPFGFSTNPEINFRAPHFDECTFELEDGESVEMKIKLAG